MALAELRRRVPVQLEGHRQRRLGVRSQRAVARRRRRRLGDRTHPHGVVVAARQQCRRVGAHSAVVWKRLYLSPPAASRSAFGVEHGPPNALDAPKPTSSRSTINTFGAPAGGRKRLDRRERPWRDPWRRRSSARAPADRGSATSCGRVGPGSSRISVLSAGGLLARRSDASAPAAARRHRSGDDGGLGDRGRSR